jgi:hypothetical protein
MNIYGWIGIAVQAVPVFFIIRTGVQMIRDKRLN